MKWKDIKQQNKTKKYICIHVTLIASLHFSPNFKLQVTFNENVMLICWFRLQRKSFLRERILIVQGGDEGSAWVQSSSGIYSTWCKNSI